MSRWQEQKQLVLATARRMVARGLVAGTSGNVSLRLPAAGGKEMIAVTPSSLPYDTLTADDIQVIGFDGQTVEGTLAPSIETSLYISIFRARNNVNAIIHTHSVHASAVAVAGRDIPPILEEQVVYLGGEIRCAPFAPGGSPELAQAARDYLGDRSGVLLMNHGAIGTGRDMDAAFAAGELIEHTARIYLLALSAGAANPLPPGTVAQWKSCYDQNQSAGA
ncbi:MAG: class II aldolase/adducin family protein [Dehalococcoidales bacterium]|nr:class II aldolase/adducin family protein [Dehalococcoidales bacterium]